MLRLRPKSCGGAVRCDVLEPDSCTAAQTGKLSTIAWAGSSKRSLESGSRPERGALTVRWRRQHQSRRSRCVVRDCQWAGARLTRVHRYDGGPHSNVQKCICLPKRFCPRVLVISVPAPTRPTTRASARFMARRTKTSGRPEAAALSRAWFTPSADCGSSAGRSGCAARLPWNRR